MKLSDEDREKLGGPEWLEYDGDLSTREAEAFQLAGLDFAELISFNTKATARAFRMVVWLCLTRAGVEIALDDCHFDVFKMSAERVGPGKAPSAKSGSRTRPASSATSTRPSRRKA